MYRTWEIVSQHQMSIVQDRRQQDGIASARLYRKSTEALWEDGGEGKEGSPMYLRVVGREERIVTLMHAYPVKTRCVKENPEEGPTGFYLTKMDWKLLDRESSCYNRTSLLRRHVGLPSFLSSSSHHWSPVRYDLATLYDTIRSHAGSDCRVYDTILHRRSCTISISEPPLLRYLVLRELRSLST